MDINLTTNHIPFHKLFEAHGSVNLNRLKLERVRSILQKKKAMDHVRSQVAQYVCPTLLVYGNTTVMSVIEHDVQTTSLKPLITHTQLCVFIRYQ